MPALVGLRLGFRLTLGLAAEVEDLCNPAREHGLGGRDASRPCEGSQPSVRAAGLLVGRVVKGFS